jgi:hypothetical protein
VRRWLGTAADGDWGIERVGGLGRPNEAKRVRGDSAPGRLDGPKRQIEFGRYR